MALQAARGAEELLAFGAALLRRRPASLAVVSVPAFGLGVVAVVAGGEAAAGLVLHHVFGAVEELQALGALVEEQLHGRQLLFLFFLLLRLAVRVLHVHAGGGDGGAGAVVVPAVALPVCQPRVLVAEQSPALHALVMDLTGDGHVGFAASRRRLLLAFGSGFQMQLLVFQKLPRGQQQLPAFQALVMAALREG